ncbi:unnamed protein product [Protopolystoma xenopodis]|uniref:Uncharacterized protein n=1 Tax=Protopolystoma xenopodis TaxID=117903 RepID=A0A448WRF5_9PLAT|nr:unnamed protein product [Protopolystoma xenopodis]
MAGGIEWYNDFTPDIRELLSLLPFRVEVLGEEIQRSVPPEDDGDWLYRKIHADAVSEAISSIPVKTCQAFVRHMMDIIRTSLAVTKVVLIQPPVDCSFDRASSVPINTPPAGVEPRQ